MTYFLLNGILGLLLPERAHAQVTQVITGMTGQGGVGAALDVFATVENAGRSLLIIVSTAMLVRAAAKMIGSISEEKMQEGRRSVATIIGGIILVNLTYAMVTIFWGGGDEGILSGAAQLTKEIKGLVGWAQVIVGVLAVAMLVISAFKVIASFGKEDAGEEFKKSITGVIIGVLLIAFDGVVIAALGGDDGSATPTTLVSMIISIVRDLLQYVGLLAVVVLIYAGIRLILSVGSEDQYGKAKALIGRVLIGLLIILFSYLMVNLIGTIAFGETPRL